MKRTPEEAQAAAGAFIGEVGRRLIGLTVPPGIRLDIVVSASTESGDLDPFVTAGIPEVPAEAQGALLEVVGRVLRVTKPTTAGVVTEDGNYTLHPGDGTKH